MAKLTSTEVTMDVTFQVHIKIPVEMKPEELKKRLERDAPGIMGSPRLNKGLLQKALGVPHYFTVARGYIDDIHWDTMKIETFTEDGDSYE